MTILCNWCEFFLDNLLLAIITGEKKKQKMTNKKTLSSLFSFVVLSPAELIELDTETMGLRDDANCLGICDANIVY